MTPFAGWQNFYVIVGSSAGALIALQFVVMTLIAEMSIERDLWPAGSAFATPTIVHFAVVLLLSAAMCAPWHGIDTVAALWGLLGLGGVVYAVIVARRMQVQTAYPSNSSEIRLRRADGEYFWFLHRIVPFRGESGHVVKWIRKLQVAGLTGT